MRTSARLFIASASTAMTLALLVACSPTAQNVVMEENDALSVFQIGVPQDVRFAGDQLGRMGGGDELFGTITFTEVGPDSISFDLAQMSAGRSVSQVSNYTVYNTGYTSLLGGTAVPLLSNQMPATYTPLPTYPGSMVIGIDNGYGMDPYLKIRIFVRWIPGKGLEIGIEVEF